MKSLLFLAIGMLCCGLIFTLIIVIHSRMIPHSSTKMLSLLGQTRSAKYVHITPKPTENCAQFPLAKGCGIVGTAINICSKQYPNYPPPADILTTTANPNLGAYTGTINHLDPTLHRITVVAETSGKSFTFQGGSVNGALYDIHKDPIDDFNTLQKGVKAFISFPCTQKNGIFKLNRFQLVQ